MSCLWATQKGTAGLESLQECRKICGVISTVKLQARWVPGALEASAPASPEMRSGNGTKLLTVGASEPHMAREPKPSEGKT